MKRVESLGNAYYEVVGEKEEAAARTLEEGLSAVTKRRSAYIDNNVDVVIASTCKMYNVDIKLQPA